jgi:hypothetical protein
MQGSLDEPPVILRSSRWKCLLALGLCTFLFALMLLIIFQARSDGTPAIDVWFAYVLAAILGGVMPFGIFQLFRPNTLIISADGITWICPTRLESTFTRSASAAYER